MRQAWHGTIPVYINNRDWLTTTRGLVEYFSRIPGVEPIVVDNASTYVPLLRWYDDGCKCKVVRLLQNQGCHAPWHCGAIMSPAMHRAWFGSDYYILTDSDLDLRDCPPDLLEVLIDGFESYPDVTKVGVSLEINDLPVDSASRPTVADWESGFWVNRRADRFFNADVDTTLGLYGVGVRCVGTALRTDRPYTARHMPWYLTESTLDEESIYYLRNASGGTWTTHLQQRFGIAPGESQHRSTASSSDSINWTIKHVEPVSSVDEDHICASISQLLKVVLGSWQPSRFLEIGGTSRVSKRHPEASPVELTHLEHLEDIVGLSAEPFDLILIAADSTLAATLCRSVSASLRRLSSANTIWIQAGLHRDAGCSLAIKKIHGTEHLVEYADSNLALSTLIPRHLDPDPTSLSNQLPTQMVLQD